VLAAKTSDEALEAAVLEVVLEVILEVGLEMVPEAALDGAVPEAALGEAIPVVAPVVAPADVLVCDHQEERRWVDQVAAQKWLKGHTVKEPVLARARHRMLACAGS